ncbi:TIGR02266 family protein [Corallococcus interemptor]|uniref:TIGR02266 family protein n=1 Tax=Corallococcus interemptor TaxID=2316720 RepID=A0A3A8Q1T5_9BACT|nr:TIGR02266 family protein [Corallococcus interemptor]RKH60035.1 TIGR02266 family protein [Corallococcus interemptor]
MPPSPTPSREAELARAEADMAKLEAQLAEQVARATADAAALSERLNRTRQALARPEHAGDSRLSQWAMRLEDTESPEPSPELARLREKALDAREAALDTRRQAGLDLQSALRVQQEDAALVEKALTSAESDLKRVEAAAKARAEAEEKARRAAEAETQKVVPPAALRPSGAKVSEESPTRAERPPARAAVALTPAKSDGRKAGRVRMHTAIDTRSDSNFFTGFSMDISEGGIFIATVEAVPRGTPVELDFTLPGGRPLTVNGVVRWARDGNDRTPDLMPGVGVQFTTLPPEVAHAISSFVATRDPMFYPD